MNFVSPSSNLLWVVAAIIAALITGTLVRLARLRGATADLVKDRLDSLRTWWVVAILVAVAALLGIVAACVLFTAVSLLALTEFLRLAKLDTSPRVRGLTFAIVPVSYAFIGFELTHLYHVLPVISLVFISATLVCEQQTSGFLNTAAKTAWGLIVTTYLLGHAALLFGLPDSEDINAGGAGWFLLLILMTETSDIVQALVGRRFGRRQLAPIVSPHKTWEGLLGGIASTMVLAMLLAPWLTSLSVWQAALGGFMVSVVGLFGDLNISALKRDAGVKDSGTLLPGQGGVLDRIDSLTFTAPAFYYYARTLIG